jgi:hypothetical protein
MTKTLPAALAVLALTASAATAAEPVWSVYPILVCRYDRVQFCEWDMNSCASDAGSATLTFDFPKQEVRTLATNGARRIIAKYFFASEYGDTNSVLADETLFSFVHVIKARSKPDTIEGVAQSAGRVGSAAAFNAHMTCHPLEKPASAPLGPAIRAPRTPALKPSK